MSDFQKARADFLAVSHEMPVTAWRYIEALEARNGELQDALTAIRARLLGEWDEPTLLPYGALGFKDDDVLRIANSVLKGGER